MYFIIHKIGLNFKFKCIFTLHMQHALRKTDVILSLIINIYFTTLRTVGPLKMVSPYTVLCSTSRHVQGMWLENGFSDSLHTHKTPYDFLLHDLGHCLLIQRRYIRWAME